MSLRYPRYEVRSITGYPITDTHQRAGSAKLGTTWWVADTWYGWREVPLRVKQGSRE